MPMSRWPFGSKATVSADAEPDDEDVPMPAAVIGPMPRPSVSAPAAVHGIDSYPYTFSPLLLFAQEGYFDKGYSNYNSVAAFFAPVLDVST